MRERRRGNISNVLVLFLAACDLLSALTLPTTAMDALWHHSPIASHSLLACRFVKSIASSTEN